MKMRPDSPLLKNNEKAMNCKLTLFYASVLQTLLIALLWFYGFQYVELYKRKRKARKLDYWGVCQGRRSTTDLDKFEVGRIRNSNSGRLKIAQGKIAQLFFL